MQIGNTTTTRSEAIECYYVIEVFFFRPEKVFCATDVGFLYNVSRRYQKLNIMRRREYEYAIGCAP